MILSGQVSLGVMMNDNSSVCFDILSKGDFLGVEIMAVDVFSPIFARCESAARCFFQKKENFRQIVKAHPIMMGFFYQKALQRLTRALNIMGKGEAEFHRYLIKDRGVSRFLKPIQKSLLYIEKNYMDPITLEDIARVNGTSKYHFSRIFKEKTGYSFKQYVNLKRIDTAKFLMRFEDLSVSEACYEVGYNDVAYFSRLFTRCEGLPPSHYKKGVRQSE